MTSFPGLGIAQNIARRLSHEALRIMGLFRGYDISIFHQFAPPPNGGGHQFLRALIRSIEEEGWRIESNSISKTTKACLFNSFNFDADRLRHLQRAGCRMIHRMDGPLATYRGFDDGTDEHIWKINKEIAHATIFQSHYSLEQHRKLGYETKNAHVIINAADSRIFYPKEQERFGSKRKIRLVSTSWSDNRNKGADVYSWLDDNLDWNRYEYVFIGRLSVQTRNIRIEPPVDSERVAELLRESDIYITASKHDPCSNSLIEALTCGLPAVCLNSGGHPELLGKGGELFDEAKEIPAALESIVSHYDEYRDNIKSPRIDDVASAYLDVMGIQRGLNF